MTKLTKIYGVTNEHAMGGEQYFTHLADARHEATVLVAEGETEATCTEYEVVSQPSKRGICALLNHSRWVVDSRELWTLTYSSPCVVAYQLKQQIEKGE